MKLFLIILFLIITDFLYSQDVTRRESLQSLYIEVYNNQQMVGSATGFIIHSSTRNYLITNYHVVTNKSPKDNSWLDTSHKISPNQILIYALNKKQSDFIPLSTDLYAKNGDTLYYRNKIANEMVDMIELPLNDTNKIKLFPINYRNSPPDSILIAPTDRVFILGYPLGQASYPLLPIWKSGLIASEPEYDQGNLPVIWVDATTFHGMSGSPVYLIADELHTKDNGTIHYAPPISYFMGIFAYGNDIYGGLWKSSYLKKIFNSLP